MSDVEDDPTKNKEEIFELINIPTEASEKEVLRFFNELLNDSENYESPFLSCNIDSTKNRVILKVCLKLESKFIL